MDGPEIFRLAMLQILLKWLAKNEKSKKGLIVYSEGSILFLFILLFQAT